MCSRLGVPEEKIRALDDYASSPHFSPAEKAALEYAEAVTFSHRDVDDGLFARLRSHYSEEEVIELTALIAWENASSKFNRALRVPSQELWSSGASEEPG